jgi:very-short-patch-repair endonuclease
VTSPARTLVDLAGVVNEERLEQAVAAAQVARAVSEDDLRAQLARSRGRRGAAALRSLLDRHAPPAATRSEAERLMLRLVRSARLPDPLVNATVGRFRPDFHWPDHGVIAEYDSYEFHTDIRAFRRDREKSNAFQLEGVMVLRFTWHDVTRGRAAFVARLRTALGLS